MTRTGKKMHPTARPLTLLLTLTLIGACGGGSFPSSDRAACDGGQTTQRAIRLAAETTSETLREQHNEIGRRAWDATLGLAAGSGDDELSGLAYYWAPYSSPLIENDIADLLEWCREHGWEPTEETTPRGL